MSSAPTGSRTNSWSRRCGEIKKVDGFMCRLSFQEGCICVFVSVIVSCACLFLLHERAHPDR